MDWRFDLIASADDSERTVDLKAAPDGRLALAFDDEQNRVQLAWKAVDGWDIEIVGQGGTLGGKPSLAFGPQGQPTVAYRIWPSAIRVASRTDFGWDVDEIPAEYATSLSCAVDSAGDPHVCWKSASFGEVDGLFYGVRRGGSWTFEDVQSEGEAGDGCSLALDSEGTPRIVSRFNGKDEAGLRFAVRGDAGWMVETLEDPSGPESEYISHRVDTTNRSHVVYYSGLGASGFRYAFQADGGWEFETIREGSGQDNGLVLRNGAEPTVSYRLANDTSTGVWVSRRVDGHWKHRRVAAGGLVGRDNAVAFDSEGRLVVVYKDKHEPAIVAATRRSASRSEDESTASENFSAAPPTFPRASHPEHFATAAAWAHTFQVFDVCGRRVGSSSSIGRADDPGDSIDARSTSGVYFYRTSGDTPGTVGRVVHVR